MFCEADGRRDRTVWGFVGAERGLAGHVRIASGFLVRSPLAPARLVRWRLCGSKLLLLGSGKELLLHLPRNCHILG